MRIAIDAHSVGTGLGGNESYATNLIEPLAEIDSHNQYTLYVTKKAAVERYRDRWPNFIVSASLIFRLIDSEKELQRVRQTYGIEGDYILSVGSIQPRKNLKRLIAAYSSLRQARPGGKLPQLVIVGKCAWLYEETLRAIRELEISKSRPPF